jgi:membrane-bound lytic murein transglycosylase D
MMRTGLWLIAALILGLCRVEAQDQTLTVDDEFLRSAEKWAKENLDDDALRALQDLDREKVKKFFADVQKQFQGQYVVDLAPFRDTARTVLPLLESYEETTPYAVWLKTRLDYLDVANEFRLTIPPVKLTPGHPPEKFPNPAPQKEREVWLNKVAERQWPSASKQYISHLKPIFVTAKVPPELVWLAELESSFDPQARSPAGAAGLFQLMPATAKRYGLRTWPLDQRLNAETSAQAAAQYLGYLHGRFKDWRLALAGYNAGEGTVQGLLDRRKARTYDQIATSLPAETQMYVPKFEAILMRREGLKISELRVPAAQPVQTGSG